MGEKRTFHLKAKERMRKGESLQLELFEAVLAQAHPDDAGLRRHFSDRLDAHQFSAAKNRLHRRILQVLCRYHTTGDPVARLREGFHAVRILRDKGLPLQAVKLLRLLEKQAQKRDDWVMLLEFSRIHQQLLPATTTKDLLSKVAAAETRHRELALRLTQEESLIASLELLQALTGRNYRVFDPALFQERPELEAPPRSFISAVLQTQIRGVVAFATQDLNKARNAYEDASVDWADRTELIPLHPDLYLRYQLNRLNVSLLTQQTGQFQVVLGQIKSHLPQLSVTFQHQLRIHYLELVYCLNYGNHTQGQALMQEVEEWLAAHPEEWEHPRMTALYHNAAVFYFLHAEWRLALRNVNRILNLPRNERQLGIQGFAPILELLLHFELGNGDYLESRLRSVLRDRKDLPPFYLLFCEGMRKAIFQLGMGGQNELWREVGQQMKALLSEKGIISPPTGHQELLFWVEAAATSSNVRSVYRAAVDARERRG